MRIHHELKLKNFRIQKNEYNELFVCYHTYRHWAYELGHKSRRWEQVGSVFNTNKRTLTTALHYANCSFDRPIPLTMKDAYKLIQDKRKDICGFLKACRDNERKRNSIDNEHCKRSPSTIVKSW